MKMETLKEMGTKQLKNVPEGTYIPKWGSMWLKWGPKKEPKF